MKLEQVRNSTFIVTYAGKQFLIDPSFELSLPIDKVLNVDAVIITRMLSSLDPFAMELFPPNMKFFVPNEEMATLMEQASFTDVNLLKDYGTLFHDIWLVKTPTKYSSSLDNNHTPEYRYETCGVILNHISEKSLYIMGNTSLYEEIHDILMDTSPDIAVVFTGHTKHIDERYLIMNKEEFHDISKSTRYTKLLASCVQSLNKEVSFITELKDYAAEYNFINRLSFLYDGVTYEA